MLIFLYFVHYHFLSPFSFNILLLLFSSACFYVYVQVSLISIIFPVLLNKRKKHYYRYNLSTYINTVYLCFEFFMYMNISMNIINRDNICYFLLFCLQLDVNVTWYKWICSIAQSSIQSELWYACCYHSLIDCLQVLGKIILSFISLLFIFAPFLFRASSSSQLTQPLVSFDI